MMGLHILVVTQALGHNVGDCAARVRYDRPLKGETVSDGFFAVLHNLESKSLII
jgi:hypothetical protein